MNTTRRRIRNAVTSALLAVLCGCMYVSHDRTKDPAFQDLVGKSFTTVQDAALIGDACIPNYAAKDCQQLQVLGGFYYARGGAQGWHQIKVPGDQAAVTSAAAAGGKLSFVPKGTPLTIVQVISRSLGEERRCWVIYAKLAGLAPDTVAEIPACFQWAPESTPLWFQAVELPHKAYEKVSYDYEDQPPLPVATYLAQPASAPNP
ncbi:MAG TPA: hypothetical protein VGM16_03350 [Gammaproteobacteria bacterium]|jgi:hypothetical protein